jgi:phage shock protein A
MTNSVECIQPGKICNVGNKLRLLATTLLECGVDFQIKVENAIETNFYSKDEILTDTVTGKRYVIDVVFGKISITLKNSDVVANNLISQLVNKAKEYKQQVEWRTNDLEETSTDKEKLEKEVTDLKAENQELMKRILSLQEGEK